MRRYHIIDEIRGITICSMILYHALWDMVYLFGWEIDWYDSDIGYWWQQSICWCFILLSGFCFSFSKKKWKRGFQVLGAGILITLISHLFLPEQKVRFGVLTMLGSSLLLMTCLEKMIELFFGDKRWKITWKYAGITISFLLFFLTRDINYRYLGFEGMRFYKLSDSFYRGNDFLTFLGFTEQGFYSTDYFSLIPWFFLFSGGYYLYHILNEKGWLERMPALPFWGKPFRLPGKNSLPIYMLHQPVIYALFLLVQYIF